MMARFKPGPGPTLGRLKTCTGWHTDPESGEVVWRQWFTYVNEPCPEHGMEFLG